MPEAYRLVVVGGDRFHGSRKGDIGLGVALGRATVGLDLTLDGGPEVVALLEEEATVVRFEDTDRDLETLRRGFEKDVVFGIELVKLHDTGMSQSEEFVVGHHLAVDPLPVPSGDLLIDGRERSIVQVFRRYPVLKIQAITAPQSARISKIMPKLICGATSACPSKLHRKPLTR